MKLQCEFAAAAVTMALCPRWHHREIAIAGRSNVGKSSLINALARRKGLARISRTPGRTQSLNFFSMGGNLAIVDLPGYGYAKMSHAQAQRMAELIDQFVTTRSNLAALLLLIDARREPAAEEFALAEIARSRGLELTVVVTKSDKVSRSERPAIAARLAALGSAIRFCSAATGEGIDQLRRQLLDLDSAGKGAHSAAG